jgi:hypothetical protein
MNAALVAEAVQAAIANENPASKEMVKFLAESYGREPFDGALGPIKDRGPAAGVILHRRRMG